jgi:DNA (cytosine-5)-methyltransferase 1
MNELALFAGAGGGILGGHLLGWRTICAVEWEPYAASVLVARQNDGVLPPFPIWDDVQTFDGRPWRGRVDVISGGFPCQDISAAGKGAGITGEKSGMWFHMARIVGEVRPEYVFVENSPMLCSRGLGTVLGDLATLGYDARWGVLGAADVGAPHQRDRIWIVAHADSVRELQPQRSERNQWGRIGDSSWWQSEPNVGRVAHGVAARVDRLKAIGNGQVPAVAATAWESMK